jgi:hypothetical protein
MIVTFSLTCKFSKEILCKNIYECSSPLSRHIEVPMAKEPNVAERGEDYGNISRNRKSLTPHLVPSGRKGSLNLLI